MAGIVCERRRKNNNNKNEMNGRFTNGDDSNKHKKGIPALATFICCALMSGWFLVHSVVKKYNQLAEVKTKRLFVGVVVIVGASLNDKRK